MPINPKYLAEFEPDNCYHVFNRAHDSRKLFYEEDDYFYFLLLFKKYMMTHVELHAYCLIVNHFHFVIRIIEKFNHQEISLQFRKMFIAYTSVINKKMELRGNLFSTPFRRVLIVNDSHYSKAIAYVHLNPLKHKIQNEIDYRYSSYSSILRNNRDLCEVDYVLNHFGGKDQFIKYHRLSADELYQG